MKLKKHFSILTITTIILATITVYALTPSEPHNANAMWIDPSLIELNATTTPVGYKFNVTVWANSSLETKGWQFWLYYQNAYINATRCGYTGPGGIKSEFFQGITTMPLSPSFKVNFNATHNRLDFGEAWIMGPYRSPGYGSLAWIEFEITSLPPENVLIEVPLNIKEAYYLDPPQTYLLYSDSSKRPLNVYNGLVRFVGEAPPPPTYSLTITTTAGGTTNPPPGKYTYNENEVVSVQANPNIGYAFDHWELNGTNVGAANPIQITMNAHYHLTAVFAALPPPTGTRIFVDPPEIIDPTLLPSSTFKINITIDDVVDLKTCIFNLTYKPEVIGFIGMRLYKVDNQFPTPIAIIEDELGYLWMKLNYQSSISTFEPKALISIEFHVDSLGATPLDLKDTQMLNSQGEPMEHNSTDGFFMSLIRDVAVTSVEPSQHWTYQNWTVNIYIKVKNKGNVSETFNVRAYYNSNLIGTTTVTNLSPQQERDLTIIWDTTGVPEGNYTIKAIAETVPYEYNLSDNELTNGTIWIMTKIHDVAILEIVSKTWAYQGWIVPINVTVKNNGDITESFDLILYYNNETIGVSTVINLQPQEEITLTFNWNTTEITPCQNYTLSGEIPPILYEYDTTNNVYVNGKIKIRIFGDVTGDGYVGIDDIAVAAESFGSTPDHPRWNEYADVNMDNYIGIDDLVMIAGNFGAEC